MEQLRGFTKEHLVELCQVEYEKFRLVKRGFSFIIYLYTVHLLGMCGLWTKWWRKTRRQPANPFYVEKWPLKCCMCVV